MIDVMAEVAEKIIREQQNVIGPLAVEQAKRVAGLTIDSQNHVSLVGDKSAAINHLVEQYKKIFGQTSVEVSKNAVNNLVSGLPPQQVPSILK